MRPDKYTARIEERLIPVNDMVEKRVYVVYRTPIFESELFIHHGIEELFNIYTDEDVAEFVVKLIEDKE